MPTSKTGPLSENAIQKTTQQYLSDCLAKDKQEFNLLLKGQLDDLITAITDSLLPNTDPNWEDIRQSVKEHINIFWQRYKKREGPKQDLAAKQLATGFRDYFSWLTCVDHGQQTYPQTIRTPISPPIFFRWAKYNTHHRSMTISIINVSSINN